MAKKQWEEEARDRFITFMHETTGISYRTDAEDVSVGNNRDFDYRLRSSDSNARPIALELFRLTPHQAELAQNSVWIEIVAQLRKELQARDIKGYLIHTPHFFVPKTRRKTFVRDLAEKLFDSIATHPGIEQFEYDGYRVTKIPALRTVEFSSRGSGGAYDPVSIATETLKRKIGHKNEQLNVPGCTRVVVIVNWNPLVDSQSVLLACSRFDFGVLENIDSVYFEVAEGKFHLVFDRSIYNAIETGEVEVASLAQPLYLQLIEARLADRDTQAFEIVRKITSELKGLDWLSENAYSSLVMIAEDFLKKDDLDRAVWIVRQLCDAPADIKAFLCWPLQQLVAKNKPELYPEILDILGRYAKDEDENLRAHVPIPLAALAARRRSINDDGTNFMAPAIGARIRSLAFEMLAQASGAAAERLSWVFHHIPDVSDVEALGIVSVTLANADRERESIATLLIYYSIYRERYFIELGKFDSERLKELLRQTLREGSTEMRSTLVWSIWKGLSDGIKIEEVLPHLNSVTEGRFEAGLFRHLYRIVDDQLKAKKTEVCDLFVRALRTETKFLLENPQHQIWHFADFFDTVRNATQCCGPAPADEIIALLCSVADRLGVPTDYILGLGI